jgi:DNA-directed RNA polymerase subunit RPC12/RpoP
MGDKVRVMRILIYEGDREMIETTLNGSMVPLNGVRKINGMKIKSAIMDQFPEIIEGKEEKSEYHYKCLACSKFFDTPKRVGNPSSSAGDECPHCGSWDYTLLPDLEKR